ncbi:MAG TPA: hypothetical protein VGW12_13650 [Pyrinomonadaceae bacterium]|nr:hypothetical protein [Pyrinomonadaceae bacterium]
MRISGSCLMLIACGFLWLEGVLASSRAQNAESTQPRMVLTYDDKVQGSEAEQWHLEDFREALSKEPNSRVLIVAYNGREDNPGKARRYALRAKNYLVNSRGIPPQRIAAIAGGRREKFIVELWLVPQGAKVPEPTPTVSEQTDPGDNLLHDSYSHGYDSFAKFEDIEARLDGFAAALKQERAAWGCVIAYTQNGDDRIGIEWDSPGTARKTSQSVKSYLVRQHGVLPSRISAVDGGYSEYRTVELWIMRPGARFDSGPFVYNHRLKAGRGTMLTITNDDSLDVCCHACVRKTTQTKNLRRRRK